MKRPSKKEIRKYFENAETVRCLSDGDAYVLDMTQKLEDKWDSGIYFNNQKDLKGREDQLMVWKTDIGYAKILTYKKPQFTPIAMKCNQEQFEAVKGKLGNFRIKNLCKKWNLYPYLVNNYSEEPCLITNISDNGKTANNRTVYEKWNEKIFLESCGIVVEEPKEESFLITKRQVIEMYNCGNPQPLIRKIFPSVFVEKKKELAVGKWYKYPDYQKWNLCVTEVDEKSKKAKGYGFGADGNWMGNALNDSWDFEELKLCIEMTPEEVQSALEKEAVKRYENKYLEPLNRHLFDRDDEIKDCIHLFDSNFLSIYKNELWMNYGKYCAIIFSNGVWAEVIPIKQMTQSDIEKELGYKIEIV